MRLAEIPLCICHQRSHLHSGIPRVRLGPVSFQGPLVGGSGLPPPGRRGRVLVLRFRVGFVVELESAVFLSGFGGPEWRKGIEG